MLSFVGREYQLKYIEPRNIEPFYILLSASLKKLGERRILQSSNESRVSLTNKSVPYRSLGVM